jgi:hypothetical protein
MGRRGGHPADCLGAAQRPLTRLRDHAAPSSIMIAERVMGESLPW